MSYTPNESFANVSRGKITGAEVFNSYGEVTTAGAVTANIVWPGTTYTLPAAAGVQMSFVSASANDAAAGTGIRSVTFRYLDADLVERSETVTLNGTTPVLSVATNVRFIQCVYMLTYGSGKVAAGNITASNGGTTYATILAGKRRCSSSVRMVPAGKRLLITGVSGGASSGSTTANVVVRLTATSLYGTDFSTGSIFMPYASACVQDNTFTMRFEVPLAFTAGMAVGLECDTDKAATITGSFYGLIENV